MKCHLYAHPVFHAWRPSPYFGQQKMHLQKHFPKSDLGFSAWRMEHPKHFGNAQKKICLVNEQLMKDWQTHFFWKCDSSAMIFKPSNCYVDFSCLKTAHSATKININVLGLIHSGAGASYQFWTGLAFFDNCENVQRSLKLCCKVQSCWTLLTTLSLTEFRAVTIWAVLGKNFSVLRA